MVMICVNHGVDSPSCPEGCPGRLYGIVGVGPAPTSAPPSGDNANVPPPGDAAPSVAPVDVPTSASDRMRAVDIAHAVELAIEFVETLGRIFPKK